MIDQELNNICVSPDLDLRSVINVLDKEHQRIVLITRDGVLLGILTDPDVRRILLSGRSLDSSIQDVMIKNPIVVQKNTSSSEILHVMKEKNIYRIPVVDENNRILDVKFIEDLLNDSSVQEAFIFAGGKGKRLRPITETIPKPLVEVGGKVLLFTIMDSLIESGIQHITLALNYKAEMIIDAINEKKKYDKYMSYIIEPEEMGTAGALSLYSPKKDSDDILVMNADILSKVNYASMLNFHKAEAHDMTIAVRQENTQIPFGVVHMDGTIVKKIEEKPVLSHYVSAGIYIISKKVINIIPERSYLDMPDLIEKALRAKYTVGSFPVHEYWLDIGRHSQLDQAQKDIKIHF